MRSFFIFAYSLPLLISICQSLAQVSDGQGLNPSKNTDNDVSSNQVLVDSSSSLPFPDGSDTTSQAVDLRPLGGSFPNDQNLGAPSLMNSDDDHFSDSSPNDQSQAQPGSINSPDASIPLISLGNSVQDLRVGPDVPNNDGSSVERSDPGSNADASPRINSADLDGSPADLQSGLGDVLRDLERLIPSPGHLLFYPWPAQKRLCPSEKPEKLCCYGDFIGGIAYRCYRCESCPFLRSSIPCQ